MTTPTPGELQQTMHHHLQEARAIGAEAMRMGTANLPLVAAWGAVAQAHATAALACAVSLGLGDLKAVGHRLADSVGGWNL